MLNYNYLFLIIIFLYAFNINGQNISDENRMGNTSTTQTQNDQQTTQIIGNNSNENQPEQTVEQNNDQNQPQNIQTQTQIQQPQTGQNENSQQNINDEELEQALAEDYPIAEGGSLSFMSDAAAGGSQSIFNPDISVIFMGDFSYYSNDEKKIPRGGAVSSTTGLHFEHLEVGFEGNVDPYFRFATYIGLSPEEVEIEEAFGETLQLPLNLQIRFGKMLLPFGRSNPSHKHYWKFVDQPLILDRINGGEHLSQFGLEINVLLPLPWYMKVLYMVSQAGESEFPEIPGISDSEILITFGMAEGEEWYKFVHLARIESFIPFSDTWSMLIGMNGLWGPSGQEKGLLTQLYGADIFIKYKPVSGDSFFEFWWQSEGYFRIRQFPDDELKDWGVYSTLAFRLAQRWYLSARADYVDGELGINQDSDELIKCPEWRFGGAITFSPSEFSVLRLQYNYDYPTWDDMEVIHEVFLQLQLTMGAHGAHPF